MYLAPLWCGLHSHNRIPPYLWRRPRPCCSRAPAAAAPGWCCPPPRPLRTPCRHTTCGSRLWWNCREPRSAPAPGAASGRLASPHRGRAAGGHRQERSGFSWLYVHFLAGTTLMCHYTMLIPASARLITNLLHILELFGNSVVDSLGSRWVCVASLQRSLTVQ